MLSTWNIPLNVRQLFEPGRSNRDGRRVDNTDYLLAKQHA